MAGIVNMPDDEMVDSYHVSDCRYDGLDKNNYFVQRSLRREKEKLRDLGFYVGR